MLAASKQIAEARLLCRNPTNNTDMKPSEDIKYPIKCASKTYKPVSAYSLQTDGVDQRFVVTFAGAEAVVRLINWFVAQSQSGLQVKIRDHSNADNPVEYLGLVQGARFKEVWECYQEFLLHDGFHELMLRIPESGDYIAFDDHGILFIYTANDYAAILQANGFPPRPGQPLIYQHDHWHVRPAESDNKLQELVETIGLLPA